MPTTRPNQGQAPVNADVFDLTGDWAETVDSLQVIVTVADDAAGDVVATARAAAGFAVTDARPLFAYNQTTKTLRVKDSSGWRDMNSPLGLVSRIYTSITSPGLAGTELLCDYAQTQLIANRWYKVTYEFNCVSLGAASLAIGTFLKRHTSDTTTIAGTQIEETWVNYTAPQSGNGRTVSVHRTFKAPATELTYVKASCQRLTGSVSYDISARYLYVEDLGARF